MSLKSYRFLVVSGLLLTSIASFSYAQGNNTAQSMQNIKQAQGTLDKIATFAYRSDGHPLLRVPNNPNSPILPNLNLSGLFRLLKTPCYHDDRGRFCIRFPTPLRRRRR